MLFILFLIVVIDLIGFGIIIPLLPFYGQYYGASPDQVGMLMAVYSLFQFISAPIMGRLSDRHGRRPVLLLSLAGATVAYVMLGFADSLWMLFIARAFGGLMAGNIATAFAYAADITTVENRAKGMGVVGAAFGVGFVLGPAIGGILAGADPMNADYQTPALVAAGMSGLALILAIIRLPESLPPEKRSQAATATGKSRFGRLADSLNRPELRPLLISLFLSTLVFAGMEAVFALWSERQLGWGPLQNGYFFALTGIVSAAVQGGLIGRLSKRFGERKLFIFGAGALGAGLLLFPLATAPLGLLPAAILMTLGFSLLNPALNSLISRAVGDHEQGAIMGTARAMSTLARVFGPLCGGALFAAAGRQWPFLVGGIVMLLVAVMAFRRLGRPAVADEAS
ncbi:MAG: MFS transporter [Magnetospiraceae bacterium]